MNETKTENRRKQCKDKTNQNRAEKNKSLQGGWLIVNSKGDCEMEMLYKDTNGGDSKTKSKFENKSDNNIWFDIPL